jgi:uncharacterized surface protein with fasciclin (FAS1) repeats
MKKMNAVKLLAVCIIFISFFAGCGSTKPLTEGSSLMTAMGAAPNLTTMTSLLKTPGLSDAMGKSLKEPFTLLAPTDHAFDSLSPSALSDLKNPANVQQLSKLLKSSIIPGKHDAADLQKGGISNAAGNPLNLTGVTLGSSIDAGKKINIIPVDQVLTKP